MPNASSWPKRRLTMGSKVPTATSGPSLGRCRRGQPDRLAALVRAGHTRGPVGRDVLADPVQRAVRWDVTVEATAPEVLEELVDVGGLEVGEVTVVDLQARALGARGLALDVLQGEEAVGGRVAGLHVEHLLGVLQQL